LAVGVLNPLMTAFIHVVSAMTFILNSARLLPAADRLNAVATKADARAVAEVASSKEEPKCWFVVNI
jgi:hypothetical protein